MGGGERRSGATVHLDRRRPDPVPPLVLDVQQRAVVEHRDGHLLVLAGPGTGKTATLTELVVARVRDKQTPLLPQQILALTFGRRAAQELSRRISLRLGGGAVPVVSTFHSFAYGAMRVHADPVAFGNPPRLLVAAEQESRLRELLTHAIAEGRVEWPESLAGAVGTRGIAEHVRALLARARGQGLDGRDLARIGRRERVPVWAALGGFLEEYLATLEFEGSMDYSELMLRAAVLANDPRAGQQVRSAYRLVVVDEYQDTDPAQVALLRGLAGGGAQVVAVGDPDQAIYGFRGADVHGILHFPEVFADPTGRPARVEVLRHVRRFPASISRAASGVLGPVSLAPLPASVQRLHRSPVSQPGSARVQVQTYPSGGAEAAGVAETLLRARAGEDGEPGLAWSQMAVLVRNPAVHGPTLTRAMRAAGIPVWLPPDESPLVDEPAVATLLSVVGLAMAPEQVWPVTSNALLSGPLGRADATQIRVLARALLTQARRRAQAESGVNPHVPWEESGVAAHEPPEASPEVAAESREATADTAHGSREQPGVAAHEPPQASPEVAVESREATADTAHGSREEPGVDGHGPREGAGVTAAASVEESPGTAHESWGVSPVTAHESREEPPDASRETREATAAPGQRVSSAELLAAAVASGQGAPESIPGVPAAAVSALRRVNGCVAAARRAIEAGELVSEVLWAAWTATDWPARLKAAALGPGTFTASTAAHRDLDAVVALFEMANRLPPQRAGRVGMAAFLDDLRSRRLPQEMRAGSEPDRDHVRLLSAHRAKGLEWELVVVASVQEGQWPDVRLRSDLLHVGELGSSGRVAGQTHADLLAEERRLMYVACTRAKRQLVVTAVAERVEGGLQPSRFLPEIGEVTPMPARSSAPMSAEGLVTALREAAEAPRLPTDDPARQRVEALRAAAIRRLAALAERGRAGGPLGPMAAADPARWWAARPLTGSLPPARWLGLDSGGHPSTAAAAPLRLSPSAIAALRECPLRWFLETRVGAAPPAGSAATIGVVVHAIADALGRGEIRDPIQAAHIVDEIWSSMPFAAHYERARERARVDEMVTALMRWDASTGRSVVATEARFQMQVPGATPAVLVRGSIDRVDRSPDGSLHVVDFKTGRTAASAAEAEEHPQLGVYQLALRTGALEEPGARLGGASAAGSASPGARLGDASATGSAPPGASGGAGSVGGAQPSSRAVHAGECGEESSSALSSGEGSTGRGPDGEVSSGRGLGRGAPSGRGLGRGAPSGRGLETGAPSGRGPGNDAPSVRGPRGEASFGRRPRGEVSSDRGSARAASAELVLHGEARLGRAELVHLSDQLADGMPKIRTQPPLGWGETWVDELLSEVSRVAAGPGYPARVNSRCKRCSFRFVCPAQAPDAGILTASSAASGAGVGDGDSASPSERVAQGAAPGARGPSHAQAKARIGGNAEGTGQMGRAVTEPVVPSTRLVEYASADPRTVEPESADARTVEPAEQGARPQEPVRSDPGLTQPAKAEPSARPPLPVQEPLWGDL